MEGCVGRQLIFQWSLLSRMNLSSVRSVYCLQSRCGFRASRAAFNHQKNSSMKINCSEKTTFGAKSAISDENKSLNGLLTLVIHCKSDSDVKGNHVKNYFNLFLIFRFFPLYKCLFVVIWRANAFFKTI